VGGAGVNICISSCVAGSASSAAAGMSAPQGIAIDQVTGQVFVTDQGNRGVDVFSATGAFEGAFGWGVDTGAEAFEFCTSASSCQAPGPPGANAGQFGTQLGYPAINPQNGNLLVADITNHRIDEFEITGNPATAAAPVRSYGFDVVASGPDESGVGFEICNVKANPTDVCKQGTAGAGAGQFGADSPTRVAVDNDGNAYVVDPANSRVQKFDPSGNPISDFAPAQLSGSLPPTDVAVNYATNHIYVIKPCRVPFDEDDPNCPGPGGQIDLHVLEFDTTANLLDTHAKETDLSYPSSLAVASSGEIYLPVTYLLIHFIFGHSTTTELHGIVILDSPLVPPTVSVDPVTIFDAHSATITGTINPNGGVTTRRLLELSANGVYSYPKKSTPDGLNVGSGVLDVPVSYEVTGLMPNSLYHVRFGAEKYFNAGKAFAEVTFTTAKAPPDALAPSVSEVTTDEARLLAKVNPNSEPATYHFEYGTAPCASNPCTSVPAQEQDAGSGYSQVLVSELVKGLDPDTFYYFRVVATNPTGTTASTEERFRTYYISVPVGDNGFPGQGFLPDNRAWEMVSPADKSGYDVLLDTGRIRVSPSEANGPMSAMFPALGPFGDSISATKSPDYLSRRTRLPGTQGWSTHSAIPAQQAMTFSNNLGEFETLYLGDPSKNFNKAVLLSLSTLPGAPPEVANVGKLYLRTDLSKPGVGSYQLLSGCTFACSVPEFEGGLDDPRAPKLAGTSADFSHVLFESSLRLTEDAPANNLQKIYKSVDGTVHFVGYVPASPARSCVGVAPDCVAAPEAVPGVEADGHYTPHVISADGSRVFFTVGPKILGNRAGKLYQRDDQGTPEVGDDITMQLNASERTYTTDPEALPATYWGATPDGSRAFFTTTEGLTDDAPESPSGKFVPYYLRVVGGGLYMWSLDPDAEGHHLNYLSADHEPADDAPPAAEIEGVQGVIGISEDGTYVYFVARGQIVSGEPLLNTGLGIYVWHEGEGVSYIGAIGFPVLGEVFAGPAHDFESYGQLGSRITPSGHHLLITLDRAPRPGGYDHGECGSVFNHVGCAELYLYDALSGAAPICVSCDQHGKPATVRAFISLHDPEVDRATTSHLNHPITDDGRYVFFSTAERLIPDDINGVTDAYVYDSATGEQSLLSSGESSSPSYFIEASSDGHDAFIATRERLSAWDYDTSKDIYDARIDGGFPEPPPAPKPCLGEACQDPPLVLDDPSPNSATFSGPGNPRRAKHPAHRHCKKSRRKARGRGGKSRCAKKRSQRTATSHGRADR
jgi:hypothetical protein